MDLDCLPPNLLISRLHDYQKLVFCKYYYFSLRNCEIDMLSDKKSRLEILKISKLKVHLKKYNSTTVIFVQFDQTKCQSSSQDNTLSECHHLFHIFFNKVCSMNGQT